MSIIKSTFAFCFPWIVLLANDNPGGALLALVMQATVIGWIPAGMWALRVMNEKSSKTAKKKKGT